MIVNQLVIGTSNRIEIKKYEIDLRYYNQNNIIHFCLV